MELTANYIIMPNCYKEIFSKYLKEDGIDCTFISSTGLFLKEGKTTCLIVTDRDIKEYLKEIIEKTKKKYETATGSSDHHGICVFRTLASDFEIL